MSIFNNVSEADMRLFHDMAISVFKGKAKLDAKVAFSITGFGASPFAAQGLFGFEVHGVISEPIRRFFAESNARLGKVYWDGASPSAGFDSFVTLRADNKTLTYVLSLVSRSDMAPFSVKGLRLDSDDYVLSEDGPTKEGVKKTVGDNVSEADMRFFHDKAMGVFREKVKLDDKIAFSIIEFSQSGSSGFWVKGVVSEPLTRYDRARCVLGVAYWNVDEPGHQCFGAFVNLFVTGKVNYDLEFAYVPGEHNYPYPDSETVPLSSILPSRAVWEGLPSGEDMAPFSAKGLRFESDGYVSDPSDAFGGG